MGYESKKQNISVKDALWIFVSGLTETRHLHDIVLGIDSLRKVGVPDKNIFVFVDHEQQDIELGPYFDLATNIFHTSEIPAQFPKLPSSEYAFLVTTGHGSELGICDFKQNIISAKCILDSVRKIPEIKSCILIIGQCYAGIFNYLDAYSGPPLVLVGATNLNLSLSLGIYIEPPITGKDDAKLVEWSGNIFLYYFFEWLRKPLDIDGDGDKTIMDAYKYAGSKSNDRLRSAKSDIFISIDMYKSDVLSHSTPFKYVETEDQLKQAAFELRASRLLLDSRLQILYQHQEPWVLNAHLARDLNI